MEYMRNSKSSENWDEIWQKEKHKSTITLKIKVLINPLSIICI